MLVHKLCRQDASRLVIKLVMGPIIPSCHGRIRLIQRQGDRTASKQRSVLQPRRCDYVLRVSDGLSQSGKFLYSSSQWLYLRRAETTTSKGSVRISGKLRSPGKVTLNASRSVGGMNCASTPGLFPRLSARRQDDSSRLFQFS